MPEKYLYIVTQKKGLDENEVSDFIEHLKNIIKASKNSSLAALILREKEISSEEYTHIVEEIAPLCEEYQVELYLNTQIDLSIELAKKHRCHIHTTFSNYLYLLENSIELQDIFLGISLHSKQEAELILKQKQYNTLKIKQILVGHIFQTDCKKDLEARGLIFLEEMLSLFQNTHIKLIAIGGINQKRAQQLRQMGRTKNDFSLNIAVMSLAMKKKFSLDEAQKFLSSF